MAGSTEIQRVDGQGLVLDWVMLPDGTIRRPIDGQDFLFWACWGRLLGWFQIGNTYLNEGSIRVSTTFLGVDCSLGKGWQWEPGPLGYKVPTFPVGYRPAIFETMVFGMAREYTRRYETIEDARKGHEKVVRYVRRTLARASKR